MFCKCSLDAQNIATLREHSANIPGILRASWGRSFIKTLSRRLPEDILKISLRRLKTSSRLFLAKANQLEIIYRLSISSRIKLLTYYHSITRQTNYINLNKLNTLKHGNNAEIMNTRFPMKCQARKYFFQELKYFFGIGVSHAVALFSLLYLEFEKRL